jgi:hypothetical protein
VITTAERRNGNAEIFDGHCDPVLQAGDWSTDERRGPLRSGTAQCSRQFVGMTQWKSTVTRVKQFG